MTLKSDIFRIHNGVEQTFDRLVVNNFDVDYFKLRYDFCSDCAIS